MAKTVLKTNGVTKSFGSLHAVNNVNFSIDDGQIKALIGPNGAGKTTLFNLITGHTKLSKGSIYFEGADITNMKPMAIVKSGIARTFQITNIFPDLSAFKNVLVARLRPLNKNFNFWLNIGHKKSIKDQYIYEIFDMIRFDEDKQGVPAAFLSYPDQRLLEMGIALATSPKLLLLDEPLSGISAESINDVKKTIKVISEHTNIAIIDHNLDAVTDLADIITVMHHGEIIFEGTSEELSMNEDVQKIYLKG